MTKSVQTAFDPVEAVYSRFVARHRLEMDSALTEVTVKQVKATIKTALHLATVQNDGRDWDGVAVHFQGMAALIKTLVVLADGQDPEKCRGFVWDLWLPDVLYWAWRQSR